MGEFDSVPCTGASANCTPRWNTAWRLSGFCLIAAGILALLTCALAVVVGDSHRVGPLLDWGFTIFGCCFLIDVALWIIGGVGMIGIFVLRRISRRISAYKAEGL